MKFINYKKKTNAKKLIFFLIKKQTELIQIQHCSSNRNFKIKLKIEIKLKKNRSRIIFKIKVKNLK